MISGGWPVPGVGVGEHVMAKGPQGLLYVGALSRGLLAVSGVTTAAGVGISLARCCTWLPAAHRAAAVAAGRAGGRGGGGAASQRRGGGRPPGTGHVVYAIFLMA
jgi:hypothetical protein